MREYSRTGPMGCLRVADALREHARLVDANWPTPTDRKLDFVQHARMRAIYDRIAHGLVHIALKKRAAAGANATRARAASTRKEPTKPRVTRKTKAKR